MPTGEYGLGIDIGDATIRAALCPADDDGTGADVLDLGGRDAALPAPHVMARIGSPTPLFLDGVPVEAADLAAGAVARIAARAEVAAGRPPAWTAVAVPPSWAEHRRSLLAGALAAAGVAPAVLVSGAEAAVRRSVATGRLADGQTALVVDLGAATLDTAVVAPLPGGGRGCPAVPPAPLPWGGRDVDDALLDHVLTGLAGPDDDPPPVLDRSRAAALRAACVAAKEALSTGTATLLTPDRAAPHRAVRVTREELEELVAGDVDAVVTAAAETVSAAGLVPADLDAVVLAGGAIRMPLIAERLSAAFGAPLVVDDDPAATVALGAACLASDALDAAGLRPTGGTDAAAGAVPAPRPASQLPPDLDPQAAHGPSRRGGRRALAVAALLAPLLVLVPTFASVLATDRDPRPTTAAGTPAPSMPAGPGRPTPGSTQVLSGAAAVEPAGTMAAGAGTPGTDGTTTAARSRTARIAATATPSARTTTSAAQQAAGGTTPGTGSDPSGRPADGSSSGIATPPADTPPPADPPPSSAPVPPSDAPPPTGTTPPPDTAPPSDTAPPTDPTPPSDPAPPSDTAPPTDPTPPPDTAPPSDPSSPAGTSAAGA